MGQIDITTLGKSKVTNDPRDLSIDFIKKAYELVWWADEHPWEHLVSGTDLERYLTYGYVLQLSKCKSPTELKHCNLRLVKLNTIGEWTTKAQTYMYKDLDIGIIKLCESYIELLKKEKQI